MTFPLPGGFRFDDLRGRTFVLTGLTRGIGRAFLPFLLEQGVRVVAVSRGLEKMEALRSELGVDVGQMPLFECDLSRPEVVAATGRAIAESQLSIDGIINNAAIDPRHWFAQEDDPLWEQVMQVNLFAAAALTRALLPGIRASQHGRLLFTGSVISELGGACLSAYAASKGALLGLTRSLAHELQGSNITVNCIIPGAIRVEKEKGGSDETLIAWQSAPRRLEAADLIAITCLLLSQWAAESPGRPSPSMAGSSIRWRPLPSRGGH